MLKVKLNILPKYFKMFPVLTTFSSRLVPFSAGKTLPKAALRRLILPSGGRVGGSLLMACQEK